MIAGLFSSLTGAARSIRRDPLEEKHKRISFTTPCSVFSHPSSPCALNYANTSLELGSFSSSSSNSLVQVQLPAGNGLHNLSDDSAVSSQPVSLSLSLSSLCDPPFFMYKARMYSPRFPHHHLLNTFFFRNFRLDEELGAGGYGFVMAASRRSDGKEVAVKFIIKDKVPEHAWTQDSVFGRIPTEILLLTIVDHPFIAKFLDLYEDNVYYYLVQELHGTPWVSKAPSRISISSLVPSQLTFSSTTESAGDSDSDLSLPSSESVTESLRAQHELFCYSEEPSESDIARLDEEDLLSSARPISGRRPSHDLFECIEQSPQKRLTENQAKYVFAQIVQAVTYLDTQGITHCDIKDENILIDTDFKVKLIDFGSAVVADPTKPRPYYDLFFGTAAYASSEVLRKKSYRAAPAEIWTLGVLLSYLLTGSSPFPTEQDAIDGRIVINSNLEKRLSRSVMDLLCMCLEPEPEKRATIVDVNNHEWLAGALDV